MPVTLNAPLTWRTAGGDDGTMLDNLQPNILKPHTRDFLTILFLTFDDSTGANRFLRDIGSVLKSARKHLEEVDAFKDSKTPGTPYIGLGLTSSGYAAIGVAEDKIPSDPSFRGGMRGTPGLNDPDVSEWETYFQNGDALHACVLVGDSQESPMNESLATVRGLLDSSPGVRIIGIQMGVGQHNANGDGIEHFGYVDGRSQPLFLTEELEAEKLATDGTSRWNPSAPLEDAIVSDVAAPDPSVHFGSYFVYRKLEQNVKQFKEQEELFAEALDQALGQLPRPGTFGDSERAGAMLIGRFEDGTPLTSQNAEGSHSPVPNNFTYEDDELGAKCPFFAHVRRTHPRGSGGREDSAVEKRHQMARRGQTYGTRADNPNDGKTENKPEKDVGLLFMAFNSNIGNQFEFMQQFWANRADFPFVAGQAHGIDPIIGQTPNDAPRPPMTGTAEWGLNTGKRAVTVPAVLRSVTMKGGEYFFMPSLAFLRARG